MTERVHEVGLMAIAGDEAALVAAFAAVPTHELAFATMSLLAVAAEHPKKAPALIRLAHSRSDALRRHVAAAREAREDRDRDKGRRLERFLGPQPLTRAPPRPSVPLAAVVREQGARPPEHIALTRLSRVAAATPRASRRTPARAGGPHPR
jgi:hypothetical protein